MFQSYINENGDLITSKSEESFANGWCQEITKEELEELEKYYKQKKKEQKWWYKLFKKLKGE